MTVLRIVNDHDHPIGHEIELDDHVGENMLRDAYKDDDEFVVDDRRFPDEEEHWGLYDVLDSPDIYSSVRIRRRPALMCDVGE